MFNFDKMIERRGSGCVKWDSAHDDDVLPLWVADMDFEAAPCIQRAIRQRAEHGIFGYTQVTEEYYNAVIHWFSQRHGWTIQRESILYTIGVVPAIACCLKAMTLPGEKVLLTTPVYNCFFSCVRNCGCEALESPLLINNEGKYVFDWEDFETKCADDKTTAYILCNPQNPGGRVWTADELKKISEICSRHHVWVISDEIHNELVMPDYQYTPYATVCKDQTHFVTCISASKSFNIAGLQMANIVCKDQVMRLRIDRAININEVCDVNPFAPVAAVAAYSEEGAEWINELNKYIQGNFLFLKSSLATFSSSFEESRKEVLPLMPIEGTYLAWVDCSSLCKKLGINSEQLEERLIQEAKVYFNAGAHYGKAGENYLRINLACPRSILEEAVKRFLQFVETYLS